MTPPIKTQDKRIEIRVAGEDLARWRATAEAEGLKLSNWIRQQCNAAAVDEELIRATDKARARRKGAR